MNKITCILCHHKGNLIKKAVDSILKQRNVKVDVIVATSVTGWNHPSNKVRVIEIPGGPATKRNIASRFAQSRYIAFFDDDVEMDKDAVYEMFTVLRKSDIGMVFWKIKKHGAP